MSGHEDWLQHFDGRSQLCASNPKTFNKVILNRLNKRIYN